MDQTNTPLASSDNRQMIFRVQMQHLVRQSGPALGERLAPGLLDAETETMSESRLADCCMLHSTSSVV